MTIPSQAESEPGAFSSSRSLLTAELQEAAQSEPIVLPPWDPMGALARA
jgi:aminopeptidase C